jgi:hypothetical protein
MLMDLRTQFNKRLPGGLDDTADKRLNRTLEHYVGEVSRVGKGGSQDILRLTYDSMAKWFKKSLAEPKVEEPRVETSSGDRSQIPFGSAERFIAGSDLTQRKTERFDSEMDPASVFASIKAARSNPTGSEGPTPAPFRMPDLQELDAKTRAFPPRPDYVQQKDIIQPHEDTVKYREVEYNLVMNSKDRDWLNNTTQNRYNFVIQFNTNYRPQGYGYQAHINTRLRNIARLEFIKAILPVEGLSVVLPQDCSGNTFPENAFYSVLALPSINVLVDEFQGNNFGTNNDVDKSLAVCQYDATWRSESVSNNPGVNRGYTLFFPKFMKAQRIYTPAPLANLQTLSFRLQDPESNLLSELPDSSALKTIVFGINTDINGSCYSDPSGNYIFLQTKDWFPLWSYSQLDKILLEGLTFNSVTDPTASTELNAWLQDPAGHSIVGIAYDNPGGSSPIIVEDGSNDVGYANWIIIRNRFKDPATGSIDLDYFSGTGNDNSLNAELLTYSQTGGILNLSRQVQLSIRVITREYDLVSNVRSDNV